MMTIIETEGRGARVKRRAPFFMLGGALALVALGASFEAVPSQQTDAAPLQRSASAHLVVATAERLDVGVDWSHVVPADPAAPLSIASYETY